MRTKKFLTATVTAVVAVSLVTTIQAATAGPTTYPVAIAPNGVGACPGATTGSLANVTANATANIITIQCSSPGGLAWGRQLDTLDATSVTATIDETSDAALLTASDTGKGNSSNGRAFGLSLKIPGMGVSSQDITFVPETDSANDTVDAPGAFFKNNNVTASAKRKADLRLQLPSIPWLQDGTVDCDPSLTDVSTSNGSITWKPGDFAGKKSQLHKFAPGLLLNCAKFKGPKGDIGAKGDKGDPGKDATAGIPVSFSGSFAPDPNTAKQFSVYATCAVGKTPIAGGFDISRSTTNQLPQVVANGPAVVPGSGALTYNGWIITVSVPSQNSSVARANVSAWVTCAG